MRDGLNERRVERARKKLEGQHEVLKREHRVIGLQRQERIGLYDHDCDDEVLGGELLLGYLEPLIFLFHPSKRFDLILTRGHRRVDTKASRHFVQVQGSLDLEPINTALYKPNARPGYHGILIPEYGDRLGLIWSSVPLVTLPPSVTTHLC